MPHQQAPLIKAALWKIWFGVYGIPRQLLSDQAKNMDGKVITNLCKEHAIRKRHSSPYHPQGNGFTERAIGILKTSLAAMCEARKMDIRDWDLLLPEAVLLINNQKNKCLKYSPFKYIFGQEARLLVDNYYDIDSVGEVVPPAIVQQDEKANRYEAKLAYKQEYDKRTSTKREFKTGDTVLLKRTFGEYPKMSVKWLYGPYTLVKRIGPVNWVVANKDGMQKVYHQDLLKYSGVRSEPEFTVEHKPYCLKKNP